MKKYNKHEKKNIIANPVAMAVFPTPLSPRRMGLFSVLRRSK